VEALAAALVLVGLNEEAKKILDIFPWGSEFFRINENNFAKYKN
jgi:ribosome biogenesis protein Tsr3